MASQHYAVLRNCPTSRQVCALVLAEVRIRVTFALLNSLVNFHLDSLVHLGGLPVFRVSAELGNPFSLSRAGSTRRFKELCEIQRGPWEKVRNL